MAEKTLQSIPPETLALYRKMAQEDLYFFCRGILGYDWLVPHIHQPVCALLQNSSNTRLRIVLPRGWLKSTICSVGYPCWLGVRNPNIRVLIAQNTFTNATKKLAGIRSQFKSNQLLKTLFPEVIPDRSHTDKSEAFELRRPKPHEEATFEAAGIRTQVVSRHYDVIIEDDTVAPDLDELGEDNMVPTKDDIEKAIGWHKLSLPLLTNPGTGRILIVGTRWFEKDLISWNTDHEPSYKGHSRACRESNGEPDESGPAVYPERFSDKVLEEMEAALGPYMFSCLYMNKPIRSDNMVFQPEWFTFYETPPEDLICYTTVDLAGDPEESKGKETDFNVVMTCGKDLVTGRIYVLDYFQRRCNPSDLIAALFSHVRRFHPVKVGIESVAYQKSMIYWIKERMRSEGEYFWVEPITHGRRSKGSRIQGLQPLVNSGNLLMRSGHKALLGEMTAFPYGAHDDVIDALSMQLPMWAQTRSVKEARRIEEGDPWSVDGAMRELEGKAQKKKGFTKAKSLQTETLRV